MLNDSDLLLVVPLVVNVFKINVIVKESAFVGVVKSFD